MFSTKLNQQKERESTTRQHLFSRRPNESRGRDRKNKESAGEFDPPTFFNENYAFILLPGNHQRRKE